MDYNQLIKTTKEREEQLSKLLGIIKNKQSDLDLIINQKQKELNSYISELDEVINNCFVYSSTNNDEIISRNNIINKENINLSLLKKYLPELLIIKNGINYIQIKKINDRLNLKDKKTFINFLKKQSIISDTYFYKSINGKSTTVNLFYSDKFETLVQSLLDTKLNNETEVIRNESISTIKEQVKEENIDLNTDSKIIDEEKIRNEHYKKVEEMSKLSLEEIMEPINKIIHMHDKEKENQILSHINKITGKKNYILPQPFYMSKKDEPMISHINKITMGEEEEEEVLITEDNIIIEMDEKFNTPSE